MAEQHILFTQSSDIKENLLNRFKVKAEELTVKVLRASDSQEAIPVILEQIKHFNARRIVSPILKTIDNNQLTLRASQLNLDYSTQLNRQTIEQAEMGISEFHMGIADLGTLVQDASSLHTRLVSMLPPVHLAILPARALVETFAQALEIIENRYHGEIPPYLSFITGPSKTADIERQLTIGVHGPETVLVLFIDELSL